MTPTNQYHFNCWFCNQDLTPKLNHINKYDWFCLHCAQNNDLKEVEYIVLENRRHDYELAFANFKVTLKSKKWHINLTQTTTSVAVGDSFNIEWVFYNMPGRILSPQNVRTRLPLLLTLS